MSKQDSIGLSLPQSVNVRGYEIKRAPLGAYLKAMQQLQSFPAEVIKSIFPGQDADEALGTLKELTTDTLISLVIRALGVVPEQVLGLVAKLAGIPENKLKTDTNIGLDGLAEIVAAWMEMNGIENFMQAARQLMGKMKAQAANSGSKS